MVFDLLKSDTMNTDKSKLGIIGTVGVPAKYGGFETLAHQLVLQFSNKFDTTVYNSKFNYNPEERVPTWNNAKIKYLPFKANGFQSIIYDGVSMLHAALFCDVLLVLGVSGCLFLPLIKFLFDVKIIINVDGLEWRRAKWNGFAKWFLMYSEKIAIRYADELVSDNAAIQKYLYNQHGVSSQLIEYGADHNSRQSIQGKDIEEFPFLAKDYVFKVARIEPENNLDMILEAFVELPQQNLVIVGNWNNSNYGKNLLKQYASYPNLYLLPPIYEPRRLNVLRSNANAYVHGHSAGGTNPSLVEAMYLALPIISFDVIYNRVTTEHEAIYFKNVKEIQQIFSTINSTALTQNALAMKIIANRRYTWETIAYKYASLVTGKVSKTQSIFQVKFLRKLEVALQ